MRAGLEHFVMLHGMRAAVRLFARRIGSEVVAMRLGFLEGDNLYLYYSGFDPRWGRYGVMTTAVAEAIKYAIERGIRTLSLSPTIDVSKSRWDPRVVEYGSACESNVGLRSRLACDAYISSRSGVGYPSKLLRLVTGRRAWN